MIYDNLNVIKYTNHFTKMTSSGMFSAGNLLQLLKRLGF